MHMSRLTPSVKIEGSRVCPYSIHSSTSRVEHTSKWQRGFPRGEVLRKFASACLKPGSHYRSFKIPLMKSGCSTHIKRIFTDYLPSNLKIAHTTRFENHGASHTTRYY